MVNILLAVILFTILLVSSNFKVDFQSPIDNHFPFGTETQSVLIGAVAEGSPAEKGGLQFGDKIESIDGQEFSDVSAVQEYVGKHKGDPLKFTVSNINEEENRQVTVIPRVNPQKAKVLSGLDSMKYRHFPTTNRWRESLSAFFTLLIWSISSLLV